jgi:hypothetical protein
VPRGSSSRQQGLQQLWDRHVPHVPGFRLLAQDSSGTAVCLVAPAPATKARGSSGTVMCPEAPAPPFLARQMSKWFCDTFTGAAIKATRYCSFVREGFDPLVVRYR